MHLEVAPGVVSRYAKGAIARLIPPPEPPGELPDGEEESGQPGDGEASTEGPGAPTEP